MPNFSINFYFILAKAGAILRREKLGTIYRLFFLSFYEFNLCGYYFFWNAKGALLYLDIFISNFQIYLEKLQGTNQAWL